MKRLLPIILCLAVTTGAALACAGCREPGENVEAATIQAGIGFSWGVLFMLAVVFSIITALTAYLWQAIRAADARSLARQGGS